MQKPELILVGGGGHCKSCIDVIEACGRYKIRGIIDLPGEINKSILGYHVIGNDEDLPKLASEGCNFLITIGHMDNSTRRRKLFDIIVNNGGNLPVIKSPSATVSKHSVIADGTIIMHYSIVNVGAKIGKNCIINNKALVEHDTVIGNNCHISTDANVNGNCTIGDNVFIGSGVTVKNGISIIDNAVIGIGSILVKSIEIAGVYVGNPAKKIK